MSLSHLSSTLRMLCATQSLIPKRSKRQLMSASKQSWYLRLGPAQASLRQWTLGPCLLEGDGARTTNVELDTADVSSRSVALTA